MRQWGSFDAAAALRGLKIAFLCAHQCIQDRPTMSCTFSTLPNSTITIPAAAGRPVIGLMEMTQIAGKTTSPLVVYLLQHL